MSRSLLFTGVPVHGHFVTDVMWRMMLMAAGMGLVMAPATESIMGSLPRAKAGVGSAVNDTTRQVGGALGVAIIGSVMSSVYQDRVATAISGRALPRGVGDQIRSSFGGAIAVAHGIGGPTGALIEASAKSAFVDGLHMRCSSARRSRSSVRASRPGGCPPARRPSWRVPSDGGRAASSRRDVGRGGAVTGSVAEADDCDGHVERRPGRPRSIACDQAILRAALDEYAERGYDGMSVDAVAARAGVGKATIYRRYQCKTDLVMAAAGPSCTRTGSRPRATTCAVICGPCWRQLRGIFGNDRRHAARRVVADAVSHPDLADAVPQSRRATPRADTAPDDRAGHRPRRALGAVSDADVVTDMLSGPIFYRVLISGDPVDDAYLDSVVDTVLAACAP